MCAVGENLGARISIGEESSRKDQKIRKVLSEMDLPPSASAPFQSPFLSFLIFL
jgi:hypothetical protein